MAPFVGNLCEYRWAVETSFKGQDCHQAVNLDVTGFHQWFKTRLEFFYVQLAKDKSGEICKNPDCDKHNERSSKHYDFSSCPLKHWEQILEVLRVLGLQSQVRKNSSRHSMK